MIKVSHGLLDVEGRLLTPEAIPGKVNSAGHDFLPWKDLERGVNGIVVWEKSF